jgi:hypothetical protein
MLTCLPDQDSKYVTSPPRQELQLDYWGVGVETQMLASAQAWDFTCPDNFPKVDSLSLYTTTLVFHAMW